MKKLSTTSSKNNSGQAPSSDTCSGQALLVILLAMSVVLTVALSVSSRSITDITTTTYEEDALRAFSAAEAGIEESLITQQSSGVVQIDPSVDSSLTYTSDVSSSSPGDEYHYPKKLSSGEIATFWFVEHGTSGFTCLGGDCTSTPNLEFCWGEPETEIDQPETPAVQILLFYDTSDGATTLPANDYSNVLVKELAFDSPYVSRPGNNNFDSATVGGCWDADYAFSANINIASLLPPACASIQGCPLFAGVRMLYNDNGSGEPHGVALRVGGGGNLPAQGIEIESTGEAGESTRKVKVVQGHPEPPPYFWGALFGKANLGS
ncbi:hypothetical protein KKB40_06635 [Patescibacteria group bacterium]|nr:hypothetical protein [Patescibacteria group bacterium]